MGSEKERDELLDAALLHCIDHVVASSQRIKKHKDALKAEAEADVPRDQGFTRCKASASGSCNIYMQHAKRPKPLLCLTSTHAMLNEDGQGKACQRAPSSSESLPFCFRRGWQELPEIENAAVLTGR